MIWNILTFAIFFLASLQCYASSEDKAIVADKSWPEIKEAIVNGHVAVGTGKYIYKYVLTNPNKNKVDFCVFSIDIRNNPSEHPFPLTDISKGHDKYEHSLMIAQEKSITPLFINSPTEKFKNTILRPAWGAINPSPDYWIIPGESLGGFGLFAKEPPGIREFHVRGLTQEFYKYPEKFIHPTAKTHAEFIEEVNKGINYYGKTIVPVKPPEPFTARLWTLKMESDMVEARKLKWIKLDKNRQEITKLIAELNTEDKAKLKATVKKIEDYLLAEKAKGNLTDEADDLVRLNAQYLLRRLDKLEVAVSTDTAQ